MARLIGLQAGHQNIQSNPDPVLASQTGAPGEEQFNVAVRDALSVILQKYGFQVQLDDANANNNPNTTGKDFAFYLAIHAESNPPGGEVAAPDPSVDAVNDQSKRIVAAIENTYFADTGIADVEQIDDGNMDFYYMWRALSDNTPCGIIECGDLQDPHDKVILADTQRVALGIAHGICNFFGIAWNGADGPAPTPQPNPNPQPPDCIPVAEVAANYYKKSDVDSSMHLIDVALELPDGSSVEDVVKKIIFYKTKQPVILPTPSVLPVTDKPSNPSTIVPSYGSTSNTPTVQPNQPPQNTPSSNIGSFFKWALQSLRNLLG